MLHEGNRMSTFKGCTEASGEVIINAGASLLLLRSHFKTRLSTHWSPPFCVVKGASGHTITDLQEQPAAYKL